MEDGCVVWFEDIESVITYTVYRNNRKKKKKKKLLENVFVTIARV